MTTKRIVTVLCMAVGVLVLALTIVAMNNNRLSWWLGSIATSLLFVLLVYVRFNLPDDVDIDGERM